MSEARSEPWVDPVWSPIRRMERPDLETIGVWLVKRLQERHIEATPGQIIGFLRGVLPSNEYWFVKSDLACALAHLRMVPLEPQPVAAEIFVLEMPDAIEGEGDRFYPAMASWAAHQNASRVEVGVFTDVPRPRMVKILGGSLETLRRPSLVLGRID